VLGGLAKLALRALMNEPGVRLGVMETIEGSSLLDDLIISVTKGFVKLKSRK
jgi:hypothetical protein